MQNTTRWRSNRLWLVLDHKPDWSSWANTYMYVHTYLLCSYLANLVNKKWCNSIQNINLRASSKRLPDNSFTAAWLDCCIIEIINNKARHNLININYRQMAFQSARWRCSWEFFGNPLVKQKWCTATRGRLHEVCFDLSQFQFLQNGSGSFVYAYFT